MVVGSGEYILGGSWWWVMVGLFKIAEGRGRFDLGGGFILRGGGW